MTEKLFNALKSIETLASCTMQVTQTRQHQGPFSHETAHVGKQWG